MADNVAITAGAGTTIATDDAGAGGHVQIVKLALSTDGSASPIPADASGLAVQGSAAHDASIAGNPVIVGGRSSAAAPSDVSGDGDAVRAWFLRNGALATVLTAGGALIGGDATNGVDVDVTRLPAGTVAGSSSLPAGANLIGQVTALGGAAHDAGVSGNPVLVAGYASAAAPTDVSGDGDAVRAWFLRNGAAATVLTAAGALIGGDAANGLDVDVTRLPNVTLAAGTNTNEVVGDAAHDAPVAGNPLLMAGYASAAAPSDVSGDGDAVRAWFLRNGAAATVLTAAGALIGGDATNGLDVDVTRLPNVTLAAGTNTNEVVGDVAHDAPVGGNPLLIAGYASAAAPSDVSGDGDAVRAWYLRNGAQVSALQAAGTLIAAGNGTNGAAIRVTLASDSTGTTIPGGHVAHDAADSGNPIKVGARAASSLSDDTMVANGDRTDNVSDVDGALIVRPDAPLGDSLVQRTTNTDGAETALTTFGATASTRNVIAWVVLCNSSATAITVNFLDGSGGTVILTLPVPAGGGVVFCPPRPIRQPTANTGLYFDGSAAATTLTVSVGGYKTKV